MLLSALMSQAKDFVCDERIPHREGSSYKLELVHHLKSHGSTLLQVGDSCSISRSCKLHIAAWPLLQAVNGSHRFPHAATAPCTKAASFC
jgi:hypothetical protein